MIRCRTLAAALCAAALAACEKNTLPDITGPMATARVKFFNYGVNAPGVNFYANDTKLTALSSTTGTESTLGTAYGLAAAGGFYTAIAPGQYTLTGRIAAATDKDLAVASVPATIEDGKAYSFYMSGPYNATTKKVDAFMIEDSYPEQADFTVTTVRFVNAISNSSAMTLYVKNTTTNAETAVGAAVAYKAAGAFVTVAPGIYDLGARTAGSATNAISRAAISLEPGKVYTVAARGDMTVTSTTAANRPILESTANR